MKMTLFTLCLLLCTVLMMASAQEVTSVEENKAIADITAFIANQSQPNSGINNVSIMCKTIFLFICQTLYHNAIMRAMHTQ